MGFPFEFLSKLLDLVLFLVKFFRKAEKETISLIDLFYKASDTGWPKGDNPEDGMILDIENAIIQSVTDGSISVRGRPNSKLINIARVPIPQEIWHQYNGNIRFEGVWIWTKSQGLKFRDNGETCIVFDKLQLPRVEYHDIEVELDNLNKWLKKSAKKHAGEALKEHQRKEDEWDKGLSS